MIFDKFCGLVERFLPEMKDIARRAKIFSFEGVPHHFLPKDFTDEEREFINENFFLPFPTVAVEDAASLIIFEDSAPGLRGLSHPRLFIECMSMEQSYKAVFDDKNSEKLLGHNSNELDQLRQAMCDIDPHMTEIHYGVVETWLEPGGITKVTGIIEEVMLLSEKRIYSHATRAEMDGTQEWETTRRSAIMNAKVALLELAMTNMPSKFVVEISPAKVKQRKKEVKIPRTHDRPIYILAEPKEIRRRMRLPEVRGTGKSPAPHERRAHTRTYRDARFKNLQGQSRVIPATWVGPSESTVGGKHYKVLLNI